LSTPTPITTGRGDQGLTDLLFGVQVPKGHPRIVACGDVDELNAALGLARASLHSLQPAIAARLGQVQLQLVAAMGQLATMPEFSSRYVELGFQALQPSDLASIEGWLAELETARTPSQKGWHFPGATGHLPAAHVDLARTVCRRAERSSWAIDPSPDPVPLFLNRLSDALWLLARHLESAAPPPAGSPSPTGLPANPRPNP